MKWESQQKQGLSTSPCLSLACPQARLAQKWTNREADPPIPFSGKMMKDDQPNTITQSKEEKLRYRGRMFTRPLNGDLA